MPFKCFRDKIVLWRDDKWTSNSSTIFWGLRFQTKHSSAINLCSLYAYWIKTTSRPIKRGCGSFPWKISAPLRWGRRHFMSNSVSVLSGQSKDAWPASLRKCSDSLSVSVLAEAWKLIWWCFVWGGTQQSNKLNAYSLFVRCQTTYLLYSSFLA